MDSERALSDQGAADSGVQPQDFEPPSMMMRSGLRAVKTRIVLITRVAPSASSVTDAQGADEARLRQIQPLGRSTPVAM